MTGPQVIQLKEQLSERTILDSSASSVILPYLEDGESCMFSVKRGCELVNPLMISRKDDKVYATGSYYVGIDWIRTNELAVQVSPKMNDGFEIDYVRMLNEALCEPDNFEHLEDLVTIYFDKPSIKVNQQQDLLSIFLITEYLNLLKRIVRKGLKKDYYTVEDNLRSKVKGRILVAQNIERNLMKGRITDNVCRYQVYDVDTDENRILKKALQFCIRQLAVYSHAVDVAILKKEARFVSPYFDNVGDVISTRAIQTYKSNPVFKEYNQAIKFAKLLLERFSYDISLAGKETVSTPPFWIDMSKLFELYVFHHLRKVFFAKGEITYHKKAHYQELDYLLAPQIWPNPYVIDAKYKPRYKNWGGITIDDAREVGGYARLTSIYKALHLDEETTLPIKCLFVYPDQEADEQFTFSREQEPVFDRVEGYVRFYKVGIRLPEIQ